MKTRAELKAYAKAQIKGNIGMLFLIYIIAALIIGAVNSIAGIGQIATLFISPAFTLSLIMVYFNLAAGIKPTVSDVFKGFNDFWTAAKTGILTAVFTFLWSLLLVIPGIIKAIAYSQALYIVAENPGMSARAALKQSEAMMNGHKMDYFILGLSFIGWMLLCTITFGIAYIWVGPYMNATMVNFYKNLKGEV